MARALAAGLFALFVLIGAAAAQAWEAGTDGLVPIPPLSAHVTDVTQTLSAPERSMRVPSTSVRWATAQSELLASMTYPGTLPCEGQE